MRSVFEHAPAAIAVLRGPLHEVDLVNQLYCDLCGRAREVLVGKPLLQGYPELAGSRVFDVIEGVYKTGETARYTEFEVAWDRDGTGRLVTACFDWTCQAMLGEDGRIEGTVQYFFDVTDRALARAQAEIGRWEAERESRAKDDFLNMLGRELRNPLSPIRTALHLMNMRGVRSREQAVIERQVGELVRVVDELFDVASNIPGQPGHRLHSIPPPPSHTQEPASHSAFGKGKRVLIVASNEDSAEILAALLKRLYFTVDIAHDSDQAMETAKSFQPEIALLDVDFPSMDGYALAGRLRGSVDEPDNLTLIAVTGDETLADPERTNAAGFRACLVKPLDPQALTQLLATIC